MARIEFRDGFREIPDHVAILMARLETWNMTFEEAVEKSNWQLASDYANEQKERIVREHLKRWSR